MASVRTALAEQVTSDLLRYIHVVLGEDAAAETAAGMLSGLADYLALTCGACEALDIMRDVGFAPLRQELLSELPQNVTRLERRRA